MQSTAKAPAIGIDLGTSNSCIAVFQNDVVHIIGSGSGSVKNTTPSCVAFTPSGRRFGDDARNQTAKNPDNTISGSKRLIGLNCDCLVEAKTNYFSPYAVVNNKNKPRIQVEIQGKSKEFCQEEISSMILQNLKEIAQNYLGQEVEDVVVSIPACFSNSQRQATRDACTIAGLNVLRILNEASASAITYCVENEIDDDEHIVLVFDLGGGTLDVSVVDMMQGVISVKSTAGDAHLGGEDFDVEILKYCVADFKKTHAKDLSRDKRALCRLRRACEAAKKTLSSSMREDIFIDSLFDGIDYRCTITREKFEEICANLFQRILKPVESALDGAKLDKLKVHDVVLVGGSSRIPKVQKILRDFFDGKELNNSVNKDEAVAYGAAIQAAILTEERSKIKMDILLIDIASMSLGIETANGVMTTVIRKNERIPTDATHTITADRDNQEIRVYEGEGTRSKENRLLGSYELSGFPPASRGVAQVEVKLSVDANSVLDVTLTSKMYGIASKTDEGRLTEEEISKMVAEAIQYWEEDQREKRRIAAKNDFQSYVYLVRGCGLPRVVDECDRVTQWIDDRQDCGKDEIEGKKREFEAVCLPAMIDWIKLHNDGPHV